MPKNTVFFRACRGNMPLFMEILLTILCKEGAEAPLLHKEKHFWKRVFVLSERVDAYFPIRAGSQGQEGSAGTIPDKPALGYSVSGTSNRYCPEPIRTMV